MARVDYDRMAADYVEGRVLPPEGRGAGGGGGGGAVAGAWGGGVGGAGVGPAGGMRAQAARTHPHPGVRWVAGVGERLPLGDGACAWAWVSTVVHHLDDLERTA